MENKSDGGNLSAGRIAIQSLCAPQCGYAEMVCIIVNAEPKDSVSRLGLGCVYQVPEINYSFFKCGCCDNVSHFISFACISEEMAAPGRYIVVYEDKDMAKLLTGYQDMLGLLHVHKVAQNNSQVKENCMWMSMQEEVEWQGGECKSARLYKIRYDCSF
ncbi:hypothetical protein B296_00000194 [Ensete ventricosum]|uniref:Uncharacterized protein n=1 Tax=Ensete ventricosum TaxID=4639 RepID=A0A427BCE1_ENSVE|nr:hypothetical protein B296_00000194 [Ensete ventricosum]